MAATSSTVASTRKAVWRSAAPQNSQFTMLAILAVTGPYVVSGYHAGYYRSGAAAPSSVSYTMASGLRSTIIRASTAGEELLKVTGLEAQVGDKPILKGVDLTVRRGEVHAIMGPNGSGKSTFSKVLVGHPAYEVTGGEVNYRGTEQLLELEPEERAQQGVFLAFQYPVEIPGVANNDFLRLAVNKRRGALGLPEYDPLEFFGVLGEKLQAVSMNPDFLSRDVNSGFSGGEKKRNEILQMVLLDPELAILDETDSGLDIDALKTVAAGVNAFRSEGNAIILITHYQRLLDYIKPDFVHVMACVALPPRYRPLSLGAVLDLSYEIAH
uniref:ABC transporter domain-containing protein n=1 Tax=Chrysotila carterae TaxID=13221 RepID=A0A7S4C5Q3_CHRCT